MTSTSTRASETLQQVLHCRNAPTFHRAKHLFPSQTPSQICSRAKHRAKHLFQSPTPSPTPVPEPNTEPNTKQTPLPEHHRRQTRPRRASYPPARIVSRELSRGTFWDCVETRFGETRGDQLNGLPRDDLQNPGDEFPRDDLQNPGDEFSPETIFRILPEPWFRVQS